MFILDSILFVFIQVTISIFGVDFLVLFLGLLEKFLLDWNVVPVDRLEILEVYFVSLSELLDLLGLWLVLLVLFLVGKRLLLELAWLLGG